MCSRLTITLGPAKRERVNTAAAGQGDLAPGPAGGGVAEELLDRLQRDAMNDERIQPMTRMVSRIHVIEEARHVRFAREELAREMQQAHWGPKRYFHRVFAAAAAAFIVRGLISPKVYEAVGLEAKSARKAALANLTRQLAVEWARYNINVNAVAPGLVRTDILTRGKTPEEIESRVKDFASRSVLGRIGEPADIAAVVAFLASPDASFVTGQILTADGGRTDYLSFSG